VWGRSFLRMLADAGFTDARFLGWTGHRTSDWTQGAHLTARKPGGPSRHAGTT
jgi:hypothetical protein